MKKHTTKTFIHGFTLIELLVVISIIGMLASIILVSLSSARQKGVVAAALTFATSNYHALGADAYVMYNFNSSNQMLDSSGNNNTATCSGGCSSSPVTPGNGGNSLSLTSGSSITTSLNIFPILTTNSTNFTESIWVNPVSLPINPVSFITNVGTNRTTRVQVSSSNIIVGANLVTYPVAIQYNQWTNITLTYSVSKQLLTMYVNGNPIGTSFDLDKLSENLGQTFTINALGNTTLIDDFAFYSQSMTASEVRQMYALGAVKHGLTVK